MTEPQAKDRSAPTFSRQPQVSEQIRAAFDAHHYDLVGELGRGGMGIVYLAQHRKLGRRVALKTLTPDRTTKENSIRRFHREARTFAQIHHPHIASLYEFEDSGPVQFLALEYVEGTDLEKERRRRRKWKHEEVAEVVARVADALDYTHKKGVLHRDIKPGNILIEKGTNRVVLTDFGLAKGDSDESLTAAGFAVGTPAYMAPEQITDQYGVKPDGRADIFSLGTVAYEMLTHRHPFLASDDLNTMRNIVNTKITPLREIDPTMPPELAWIIEKMMEKNPKERFPDAGTLLLQINTWLGKNGFAETPGRRATPTPAAPSTPTPSAPPSASRPQQAAQSAKTPASKPAAAAPAGISVKVLVISLVAVSVLILVVGVVLGIYISK